MKKKKKFKIGPIFTYTNRFHTGFCTLVLYIKYPICLRRDDDEGRTACQNHFFDLQGPSNLTMSQKMEIEIVNGSQTCP